LARIRTWLCVFVLGLVLSGLTAFPLETETRLLVRWLQEWGLAGRWPELARWITRVHQGLSETYSAYPFVAYGTDWLAFAHLVIALAFWGCWRDPVRNVWVVDFGMIACAAVIPFALVCGRLRGIPWFWQCVDMSFGVLGLVPLGCARRAIRRLPGGS
jgi:hypothetical protein